MEVVRVDVLVIGSGAAGMLAALECIPGTDVMMACKGPFGRDGATITAQADIAVDGRACRELLGLDGDPADTPDRFAADMLREGSYLGDESLIAAQCESIGREVRALADRGLKLRGLLQNPGHSALRSVWISARELTAVLRRDVLARGVRICEYTLACELIVEGGETVGAILYDRVTGAFRAVSAAATILATGGGMRLYPHSTAPIGLTGDGLAMAYRVGAALSDMEFPMFLPYTLLEPAILRGVTFTHDLAMLTDARALNRRGERFMEEWDPVRKEHSTRDVNAAAAGVEIAAGRGSRAGGVWLSLTHLPANLIEELGEWLPEGLSGWHYGGFDLKRLLPDLSTHALDTAPASHFWNGGVVVDDRCRTDVPNLFAAGEGIAGLNGANRISGNGLAQAIVWGARAGRFASAHAARCAGKGWMPDRKALGEWVADLKAPLGRRDGLSPRELANEIRSAAWKGIGLVRDEKGLSAFLDRLDGLRKRLAEQGTFSDVPVWNEDFVLSVENANMLEVAGIVAAAALRRTESRGAHYRSDFPETDEAWNVNVAVRSPGSGEGKARVETSPAKNGYARERRVGRYRYGDKRRDVDAGADR